jgi:hypothetical protein
MTRILTPILLVGIALLGMWLGGLEGVLLLFVVFPIVFSIAIIVPTRNKVQTTTQSVDYYLGPAAVYMPTAMSALNDQLTEINKKLDKP